MEKCKDMVFVEADVEQRVGCRHRRQMRMEGGWRRMRRMNATGVFVPGHPPPAPARLRLAPNPQ